MPQEPPQYERSQQIKPTQAVTGFGEAMGKIGQASLGTLETIASNIAQESANKFAAIQGAEAASRDLALGKSQQFLPIGQANKYFAESYQRNQVDELSFQGQKMLETYMQQASQSPTGASLADYEEFGKAGIADIVSKTPREYQAGMRRSLEQAWHSGFLRLSSQVENANNKYLNSRQSVQATQQSENITNYGLQGNYEAARNARDERINITIPELERLFIETGGRTGYSPEQAFAAREDAESRFRQAVEANKWEEAHKEGKGEEFIEKLRSEPPEHLTPLQQASDVKALLNYSQAWKAALKGQQTINYTNALTAVDSGQMTPGALIEAQRDMSELDYAKLQHHIALKQNRDGLNAAKVAEAWKEIGLGRAGAVDKKLINNMFLDARKQLEEQQGAPATLPQQFEMVKRLQTNVPKFDQDMAAKLTSQKVPETVEAGRLYSTATLDGKDGLIHLSGDAATMAEKVSTLLNGTANPSQEAVQDTIRRVLKATDPEVAQRNDQGTKIIAKEGPGLFKQLFGREPDPFMDNGAYAVFKDQFLNAYARGANEEEAARITRKAMREWGPSEYFEEGKIEQFAPEKELPLSLGTQNIRNQMLIGVDEIVRANNEGVAPKEGKYRMKLLGPALPERVSQESFVYDALDGHIAGTIEGTPTQRFAEELTNPLPNRRPIKVEVDGIESEVVLKSSRQTKATGDNPTYGVFMKDKFGIYQQMTDPRNPDGLAYITLKDLDNIAPELFEGEGNARLVQSLNRALGAQLQAAAKHEITEALKKSPGLPRFTKFEHKKPTTSLEELKEALKQNEE